MSHGMRAQVGRRWGQFGWSLLGLAFLGCGQAGSGSGEVPSKEAMTSASAAAATATAVASADSTASPTASAASSDEPVGAASGKASASAGVGVLGVPSGAPSGAASAEPTASATASVAATPSATASAEATAEPALTVQSPKQQAAAFAVWMQSAKTYKVGQSGSVEVVLVPSGEYHCNQSYPYKVKLGSAPAGISYAQDVVRGASVSEKRASIRVPFTATAAGDARISGKFHFSVCTSEQCVIDTREVSATVKVE